jgi:hypothetical protein
MGAASQRPDSVDLGPPLELTYSIFMRARVVPYRELTRSL